jgi:tetratricopeptide (TPR) repeat protein
MSLPSLFLVIASVAHLAVTAPPQAPAALVPASTPVDSLPRMLAALEAHPRPGASPADAAFLLGQLHHARGEYRQAAEAFARAANRRSGEPRGEARYRAGVSLLGAGQAAAAREAFAAAIHDAPSRAALAQLGIAQALEAEQHPDKAFAAYQQVLAGDAGEAGPAALERIAALGPSLRRDEDTRRARLQLARQYPASLEAARLAASPPPAVVPAATTSAARTVQIGVFSERARALALVEAARKAGFSDTDATERAGTEGRATVWVVRLGRFASADAARAAGEKAERALGVSWKVVTP